VRCAGEDETVRCVVNMGTETALVRCAGSVLLSSSTRVHSAGGTVALPPNSAVWLLEH
jgi:alpha-glucosidase